MKKYGVSRKWAIAVIMMMCVAFFCTISLKFDGIITWGITVVSIIGLTNLGEKAHIKKGAASNLYLLWGICTVLYVILSVYCLEQGKYRSSVQKQIGMMLCIDYILVLIIYGKDIWAMVKDNLKKWIPSLWCLIIGVGLMLYIKESNKSIIREMILGITGAVLIAYLLFDHFRSREQKVTYHISALHYISSFIVGLFMVVGIGICIPDIQELPGTRWIRQVVNHFNNKIDWNNKIPLETKLDNEFPLSEAVLFEVNASESLYLRSIAYSYYEDSTWSIESYEGEDDNYITLRMQYLQAEYLQTQGLLDEIKYQNSQDATILSEYAKIAHYESSVTNKKKYTILQNPINKINYFTVNGMSNIEDASSTQIHYYKNINTCYFYGDLGLEPNEYTVEYYDHVPKIGSREYIFLHSMSADAWTSLYKQVVDNRKRYHYEYNELSKLLLIYTPMIQYKNAQKTFLQVPEELQEFLEPLAQSIILDEKSDWKRAERICTYLKNQYTYNLHSSYSQDKDRIYSFLFENREGICQEFASSMVLLCRSIGIPAKYVTGYLVTEKNPKTGNYIVREKDAHAFVEVYIAGYGWMTFDPTPEMGAMGIEKVEAKAWDAKEYIKVFSVVLILGVLVFISKNVFFNLNELRLKIILIFGKSEKQLQEVMKCTMKYLEKQGYKRKTHETLAQYAKNLRLYDIEIIDMIKIYEAYIYGNKKIEKEDIKKAHKVYKELKIKFKK